jgi:hypothetical protein
MACVRGRRYLLGPMATWALSEPASWAGLFDAVHTHTATSGDLALGSRTPAPSVNGTTVATLPSSSGAATTASSRLYLVAGINRIKVSPNSGATVTLRDLKVAGSGDTSGVTKIEAESGTLAGAAKIQSNVWTSGGKDVGYVGNGSANTLTFNNISVPAAGRYALVIHYANNDRSGTGSYNTNVKSRTAQLTVNGGTPATSTFRNTYGWSDFWSLGTTVNLNAGTNTLKISNSSSYAPDIDYIEVAPVNG